MTFLEMFRQKKTDHDSQKSFAKKVFPWDLFVFHFSITLIISIILFVFILLGSLLLLGTDNIPDATEKSTLLYNGVLFCTALTALLPWIKLFRHIKNKRMMAQSLYRDGHLIQVDLIDPVYAKRSRGLNTYPVTRASIAIKQNETLRKGHFQIENHIPLLLEESFRCPILTHPDIPICVAFPYENIVVKISLS